MLLILHLGIYWRHKYQRWRKDPETFPKNRNLTYREVKTELFSSFPQKLYKQEEKKVTYLYCVLGGRHQTRILYPGKLFFKNEIEIKMISDKTEGISCQYTCLVGNSLEKNKSDIGQKLRSTYREYLRKNKWK